MKIVHSVSILLLKSLRHSREIVVQLLLGRSVMEAIRLR